MEEPARPTRWRSLAHRGSRDQFPRLSRGDSEVARICVLGGHAWLYHLSCHCPQRLLAERVRLPGVCDRAGTFAVRHWTQRDSARRISDCVSEEASRYTSRALRCLPSCWFSPALDGRRRSWTACRECWETCPSLAPLRTMPCWKCDPSLPRQRCRVTEHLQ